MTERRGDPGFTVAPRRLGDGPRGRGPRRARRLGVAIVAGAALAIVTIAFLGPRLSGKPNLDLSFFATPIPSATPTPTPSVEATPTQTPEITPLPEVTRPEGLTASGRVAIGADGMRLLDLGDGTIEPIANVIPGRDAVVRAPGGDGWTCVCFVDDAVDGEPVRIVRIIGIDADGRQTKATDVMTEPAVFPEAGMPEPAIDVDVRVDGRTALLAIGSRIGPSWTFRIASLDLVGQRRGPTTELGKLSLAAPRPSPGPTAAPDATIVPPTPEAEVPADAFVDGPHIRIAPGGRMAFVWAVLQSFGEDGSATAVRGWRVALGEDGEVGEVGAVAGFDQLPMFCPYVGFAASDRMAWFCPRRSDEPSSGLPVTWELTTIDLDGRPDVQIEIPTPENSFFAEPLFDRANGWVYAWDPSRLVLTRLDVHSLVQESVTFDPAAGTAPGITEGGGSELPDWHDAGSAFQGFAQIAGTPHGSRLYLVGSGPVAMSQDTFSQRSLGIFVVDRTTLALTARWAPAANYVGVALTPDGQVLAMGLPGVDADGREAPWEGSLTVHDPTDGRILVRYGRLGQDGPPLVVDR